ncbi:MAG: hypothetical protein AB8B77_01655 [Alphaproteobacteria bacterium]
MPQFDQIESFAGQIFWLIVFFGLIYFLMSKIVLPRIAEILEARGKRIEMDLIDARRQQEEAEMLLAEVSTKLDAAREDARKLYADAEISMTEDFSKKAQKLEAQIADQFAEAEASINAQIEVARKDIQAESKDLAANIVYSISGSKIAAGAK